MRQGPYLGDGSRGTPRRHRARLRHSQDQIKHGKISTVTVMGIVTGHNAHTVRLSIQLVPVKAHSQALSTVKAATMEGAVDWSRQATLYNQPSLKDSVP